MSDSSDEFEQNLQGEKSENSNLRKQLKDQRLRADTAEGALEVANRTLGMFADDLQVAERRVEELIRALAGMLFAFDDGVGRDWSAPLLDYARKLTNAAEFDAALNPNPEAESHE